MSKFCIFRLYFIIWLKLKRWYFDFLGRLNFYKLPFGQCEQWLIFWLITTFLLVVDNFSVAFCNHDLSKQMRAWASMWAFQHDYRLHLPFTYVIDDKTYEMIISCSNVQYAICIMFTVEQKHVLQHSFLVMKTSIEFNQTTLLMDATLVQLLILHVYV